LLERARPLPAQIEERSLSSRGKHRWTPAFASFAGERTLRDENTLYETLIQIEKLNLQIAEEKLQVSERLEGQWRQKAFDAAKRERDAEMAYQIEYERVCEAKVKALG